MDSIDYKEKAIKYKTKTNYLINSFNFSPNTIKLINEKITYYSFLKDVITSKSIERKCNFNEELQITIKIGDTNYVYHPSNKVLITYNDITMYWTIDELIQNNSKEIDLSDPKYDEIIKNCVILGYIFLLKHNKAIKFFTLKKLYPFVQKIVQMVFENNKKK
jgi:hypothetical protein